MRNNKKVKDQKLKAICSTPQAKHKNAKIFFIKKIL